MLFGIHSFASSSMHFTLDRIRANNSPNRPQNYMRLALATTPNRNPTMPRPLSTNTPTNGQETTNAQMQPTLSTLRLYTAVQKAFRCLRSKPSWQLHDEDDDYGRAASIAALQNVMNECLGESPRNRYRRSERCVPRDTAQKILPPLGSTLSAYSRILNKSRMLGP